MRCSASGPRKRGPYCAPGIDDLDHFSRFMAAKTMFTDEGESWDNVGWLFSADRPSADSELTGQ